MLIVAEHILSSTVPLTNLLRMEDNDLLHAVTETGVVIKLCNDERADKNVWNALYDKAVDVSSNFAIHPTMPRRAGRQQNRANPDVQSVSDFYRVTLYYVFLDHLVQEMETRILGNEDRYCTVHNIYCHPNCLICRMRGYQLYTPPLRMIFLKHMRYSSQK